jgi:hypothetical protein
MLKRKGALYCVMERERERERENMERKTEHMARLHA